MEMTSVTLRLRSLQASVTCLYVCILFTATEGIAEVALKKGYTNYGVPRSLHYTLATLKRREYKNNLAVRFLLKYLEHFSKLSAEVPMKHPFIVIEGIFPDRKHVLATKLSQMFGAKQLNKLPNRILRLRHKFKYDIVLRKLFYTSCLYITSFLVRDFLNKVPVVLSGYWMAHVAYNLVKENMEDLPPQGSDFYQFPSDLLQPDLILYVNIGNQNKLKNGVLRSVNDKTCDIFERMKTGLVYECNMPYFSESALSQIKDVITRRLAAKYKYL